MIKTLKRHVCLCALTTSVFFFVNSVAVNARSFQDLNVHNVRNFQGSCNSYFHSYLCDGRPIYEYDDGSHNVLMRSVLVKGVEDEVFINKVGIHIRENSVIPGISGKLRFEKSGVIASEVLAPKEKQVVFDTVFVTGNGKRINGSNGSVSHAVFGVEEGGTLFIKDSNINVIDTHGLVGESLPRALRLGYNPQDRSEHNSLSKVFAHELKAKITGAQSYGLYFRGDASEFRGKSLGHEKGGLQVKLGEFRFNETTLEIPDSTAIYVDGVRKYPYIALTKGSRVAGDLLLEAKNHSSIKVESSISFLVGGARVDNGSYAEFGLFDDSKWTLTPKKKGNLRGRKSLDSSVSRINIVDSSIVFEKPTNGNYQTLHVGQGLKKDSSDYAYVAQGNARLYVNTYWGAGDQKGTKNQKGTKKTDRLFIYGNVSGTTTVHVQGVAAKSVGKKGRIKNNKGDDQSISIVQVYGNADRESFKLAGGYATLKGSPYRYRLRAYGPKEAESKHRLIKGDGNFWDFRLENEYVKLVSGKSHSKSKKNASDRRKPRSVESVVDHDSSIFDPEVMVSAVVPQVPSYLLLPNALFHAGLMDVNNQNKRLESMRTTSSGMVEVHENPAFFVRSYGGSHHYASDLSALEYGYGGDFNYNAVEADLLLKTIEGAHHATSFGVMGTYGKLSLQPVDVEQSQKSKFDKWSVTAYGGMQHDAGFYVNGLFSYGLLKGDVSTLARGKTATLKSNPLSASLTAGKAFKIGHNCLVFDPQIQVIYQNLRFDKASDIDGFDIEMGKPEQWVMRVGGRLTKTLPVSKEGRVVSLNGKLHITRGFGEKQFVHLGDSFQLGAFGSSLEAGLGFNAQLSPKFVLYGDATYQQRLSKAGFSGTSFSGGLRYRF
ncbi:autotransporter outer membrane beta-barrel domain-containing protein [Bartonella gliris]|uniref:autotransporter outer membrane beta-barrel domain-containing protein n=1 Tax=Bartonella gliris TaxID=3004109 RepID=UPI003872FA5E